MTATGFNHVSIPATRLEESVRFYEELFAMQRIATYNFGCPAQYLRCGAQQLHLYELPDPTPTYQHFSLNVENLHDVYDKAKARSALDRETFGTPIRELPDGSVQMYLRDPGGNLVEVNWPDADTLDRSRLPEMVPLADQHPQAGENLEATLFLGRKRKQRAAAD